MQGSRTTKVGQTATWLLLLLFAGTAPAAAQGKPSGTEDTGLEELEGSSEGEAAPESAPPKPAEAPSPEETAGEQPEGGPEAAPPAPAPEAAAKPAPEVNPASSEEMVVTGSRVKHTKHALPTAVDVVDRKQLAQSGADNMAEVVRTMDINRGSEVNTAVSTAAIGTTQFNLRGLGLSSTLVLLNGRRLVMSGALSADGSNFVDINTVPMPMLERIEILKGGASAIYGSDAVAGVVNMITRKHVNGFEAQAGGMTTDKFDHHEWDVSLLGGAESEHTRVMGVVTYLKREPLFAQDRKYTDNGKNTSNLGWPSAYVRLSPTGVPVPGADETGMVNIDMATMMPSRYATYLDPGCGTVPLSSVSPFPPATKVQAYCKFDFNRYFMLMAAEQRVNTYTTIEHDIGDHAMVFAEAGYAHNTAFRTTSPAYPILTTVTVPADNTNNPTGNLLSWVGRVAGGDSPPYKNTFDSDTLHTVAGFKGDFGGIASSAEDWEWEIAGTYGTNRFEGRSYDVIKGSLQTALNSCKPTDDPANCYNPFSFGAPNSQAIKNRITGQTFGIADTELTTASVDINGPLFRLPGGDLSLAVGGQVRRETAKYDADHDANLDNYIFLIGAPDFQASRRIVGGYGELVMPFVRGLEVQAAGRAESYNDAGSALSPMFGLSWTPATSFMGDNAPQVSKVLLRGTYTNAFRAPSLLQEYGSTTELAQITNVSSDMAGTPVRAAGSTFAAVRTVGNTGLKPQTSNAISAGIEWGPVKGLTFTTDYWLFNYKDIIVKEKGQNIVDNDFMYARMPANANPNVQRNPTTGQPSVITAHFVNASSVDTQGIDVGLTYRTDFGANAGTYSAGASGTYVLNYDIPVSQVGPVLSMSPDVTCSGGKCNVAGLRNFTDFARPIPQLRATIPLTWSLEGHSAAIIGHFIGSYKDDENPAPMTNVLPGIKPWFSLDLQYSYRLQESKSLATKFTLGVINVLDTQPPTVNTGLGYDVLTHDPRGRMIYGRLTQEL